MSILQSLFGSKRADAPQPRPPAGQQGDQNSTRRELLRVVLRDTLARHGIPGAWIGADMLTAARAREPGLHLRLVLKHWDPTLVGCTMTLQKQIVHRVMLYDPLARNWLLGISWQYALQDDSMCPPMPDPKVWRVATVEATANGAAAQESKSDMHRLSSGRDKPRDERPDFRPTQPMSAELQ